MTSIEQTCYTSMVNIRNNNVFASQLHEIPYDYYRYTPYALEEIFKRVGFKDIKIKIVSKNFFAAYFLR